MYLYLCYAPHHQQQQTNQQAKSAGWTVQGDIVVLPANAFNTAVQKRTQDLIGFDAVAPVLKHTVVAV